MKVLVIAPFAPPINTAEAHQVGRYLDALSEHVDIVLVTEAATGGWAVDEPDLSLNARRICRRTVASPFRGQLERVAHSRALKWTLPLYESWPLLHLQRIEGWANECDVIYSRSAPTRSAVLARHLKERTGKPWIMHLSDPWVDNPYLSWNRLRKWMANREERACFEHCNTVALTTVTQAEFYRRKYRELSRKIIVSPNVLPRRINLRHKHSISSGTINIVYTGSMYGARVPVAVIESILSLDQSLRERIHLIIAGNADTSAQTYFKNIQDSSINFIGPISYSESVRLQSDADVLLSFEPDGRSVLYRGFLPSKILDYLANRRPILAITPKQSETWKLVGRGFGWTVEPTDREGLSSLLRVLAEHGRAEFRCGPLDMARDHEVSEVAKALVSVMSQLAACSR